MADADPSPAELRVLVLAPTARDADLCRGVLAQAGLPATVCPDLPAVCRELETGAGAAVLTEEALARPEFAQLAACLADQPPWSDLPLVVLTRAGADSEVARQTLELLGNVTLLERPVRVPTLVSAVRAALRGRRRQYQMRATLAALRDADRRKDEFLAMLAHELRNPLAPIRTGLELLRADPDPAAGERVRGMMARQVDHLVRLVDDLLDVSRILRGKIELRAEPLDLGAVVERAVETARPLVDAQRHALTVALPAGRVAVVGDEVRLVQVVANLLNNAAKYTDRGGHLALTAGVEGGRAVVRVRDDGLGIGPDLLPRVFDLFTQAERSLDRSQGGLGLGLTLVRRLVEMHGGTVEARSDGPGRGSEFVVRLPLAGKDEGGGMKDETQPASPGTGSASSFSLHPSAFHPRRVLVVDDNADAADSLQSLLTLVGHDVRVARDGPAALAEAGPFRPEVVFLDIGLPVMDGYEVARRLVAAADGAGPPFLVALTGYGQEDDRRRSAAAGFAAHLTKPADPAAVLALLRQPG